MVIVEAAESVPLAVAAIVIAIDRAVAGAAIVAVAGIAIVAGITIVAMVGLVNFPRRHGWLTWFRRVFTFVSAPTCCPQDCQPQPRRSTPKPKNPDLR